MILSMDFLRTTVNVICSVNPNICRIPVLGSCLGQRCQANENAKIVDRYICHVDISVEHVN